MKNLVTGGAGFLGSHLIEKLISSKEEVICLDNFFTGSKTNIEKYFSNPLFNFIEHDVIDPISLDVDKIWHLACPASPIHYQLNPIKTTQTSFLGTYNMLNLAKEKNARILIASTSEVYGDPEIHPQSESYKGSVNTFGIRACYDEGKRIAETLSFDFNRMHNVDIRIARIFNTYGPKMLADDGRVISNFIVQALKAKPLTIYGDGVQTRSFCYVSDLITGLSSLMESNYKKPINIGNPEEYTIFKIAEIIKEKINSDSNIIKKNLPDDDPLQRKPDIKLANEVLNWRPEISLNEGLNKTITYFKENLKI